ncbi:MAG: DUF4065 domain-containing protein [Candidatus Symbiobacter sp.]|nr:DUF4065 domain-containing protein [Candidatus Symbiobacter sp.]
MEDKPPYPAASIANYFLDKAANDTDRQDPITPMKLQKLIYFAHGWHLGLFGRPLIKEDFEAWDYGPVVPNLYQQFKQYGKGAVTSKAFDDNKNESAPPKDERTRNLLKTIWDNYGHMDAMRLSRMTHADGSPWDDALGTLPSGQKVIIRNKLIPDEKIRKYFKSLADSSSE